MLPKGAPFSHPPHQRDISRFDTCFIGNSFASYYSWGLGSLAAYPFWYAEGARPVFTWEAHPVFWTNMPPWMNAGLPLTCWFLRGKLVSEAPESVKCQRSSTTRDRYLIDIRTGGRRVSRVYDEWSLSKPQVLTPESKSFEYLHTFVLQLLRILIGDIEGEFWTRRHH